jgi:hypothetical protein
MITTILCMLEMLKLGQSVNNVSCNLKRVAFSCFGHLLEASLFSWARNLYLIIGNLIC